MRLAAVSKCDHSSWIFVKPWKVPKERYGGTERDEGQALAEGKPLVIPYGFRSIRGAQMHCLKTLCLGGFHPPKLTALLPICTKASRHFEPARSRT